MRHINIPVFIPHLGCPNQCVFCNQRTISGINTFNESSVTNIIVSTLDGISDDCEAEIAFFGGSFTGIDRALMIRLLDTAQRYVVAGRAAGIRMSTRPDYIDDEIITILKNYTVSAIELGIQSFSDKVLAASRRGHTTDASVKAVGMLRDAGFSVVGQMMIGLPESAGEDEVHCAEMICSLGASASRIYPLVVFRGTPLQEMCEKGNFVPLDFEETVMRTKNALKVFIAHGVPCIRVGLCESEQISSSDSYYTGVNHGAIGEIAMGEIFYDNICDRLAELSDACSIAGSGVTVTVAHGKTSMAVGHGGRNKVRIKNNFGLKYLKIIENDELTGYNIKIGII